MPESRAQRWARAWWDGRFHDLAAMLPPTAAGSDASSLLAQAYATWVDGDWARGRAALAGAGEGSQPRLRVHAACFASLDGDDAVAQAMLDADLGDDAAGSSGTVRAWLALRAGQPAEAESRARSAAAQADRPEAQALAWALRCHALQALHDHVALHGARQVLQAVPLRAAHVLSGVHLALLDATVAADRGDDAAAVHRLGPALQHVQRHALWAIPGAPTAPLARLLALALHAGIEAEAAARLVRVLRLPPPDMAGPTWPWPVRLRAELRAGAVPQIELHGRPLVHAGKTPRRPLELLQTLLLLGGRAPVTRLADRLWPEAEGDRALGAFEVALRRLRRLLQDPQALRLQAGVLTLNRDRVWVDAAPSGDGFCAN